MFLNKINKKKTYLIIGLIFIIFWLWPLWNMNDLAVVSDGNLYLQNTEAIKIAIFKLSTKFPAIKLIGIVNIIKLVKYSLEKIF